MYILVLIVLIFVTILTYIIFREIEHCIDNQREIEQTLINTEKTTWRIERDLTKIRKGKK